jgi:four helix bundle protein
MFKFETFDTWKRAIEFANEVFELADGLPQRYQFSLGEQLRRAALSIPTNLAEGSGRDNSKEKRYFYRIAKGSVYEVVSLLVMAGKRGALSREKYRELYQEADEIAAMISGAMASSTAKSQGARGKS